MLDHRRLFRNLDASSLCCRPIDRDEHCARFYRVLTDRLLSIVDCDYSVCDKEVGSEN